MENNTDAPVAQEADGGAIAAWWRRGLALKGEATLTELGII